MRTQLNSILTRIDACCRSLFGEGDAYTSLGALKQGSLATGWIISAVNMLATNPAMLKVRDALPESSPWGCYVGT